MSDVDYDRWAQYLDGILTQRGARSVFEAACGTGMITRRLYEMGYSIIASDKSPAMLGTAKQSARKAGCDITFVLQDMRHIEAGNKFDAVISACDGVNYLDSGGVTEFVTSAYAALKENGVLLFDISSKAKLAGMDGEVYFDDGDDASCIWKNTYDGVKSTLKMDVTLFVRKGELFERFEETHVQYAHDADLIVSTAITAGFKNAKAVACFTDAALKGDEQRIQFICSR